jgi:lysyl endopeptidase
LVVFWNYENSTCRTPGSGASGGAGDGSLTQFNTGSFFRADFATSDMTLMELDDPINPAYDVYYAGWDRSGVDATSAVAIHHPNTDEKRISFENDPTSVTTYLQNPVPGDASHIRITQWDLGTTEPGSSGSPLFDQNHRIIGQLHGGFASCSSLTSDWYGRFFMSWTGGGTNATRLSNWLDPIASGRYRP